MTRKLRPAMATTSSLPRPAIIPFQAMRAYGDDMSVYSVEEIRFTDDRTVIDAATLFQPKFLPLDVVIIEPVFVFG